MIENELSYVFQYETGHKYYRPEKATLVDEIDDYYLDRDTRIRIKGGLAILTRKTGEKSQGFRQETECLIPSEAARILCPKVKLHIKKTRYSLNHQFDRMRITLDMIEKPMKLAVIEFEKISEKTEPIDLSIPEKFFGHIFEPCPLSSYDLFIRKIGICGGPSSGKSETAKILSHRINTELGGNSFSVAEFATTFIQKYQRTPDFLDQFWVWHGQKEREQAASKANVVISDCPTFLSYVYMLLLNREQFSERTALFLAKMYKRVLLELKEYSDLIFLSIINYADNNVRYQSKEQAVDIENRIRNFLNDHRVKYIPCDYTKTEQILRKLFWINS